MGSEQRPLGVVQFWEKYTNCRRVFEASDRRKGSGDSAGRETGLGRTGSAFCGLEKRARAEGKAGKGLQGVCLPSAANEDLLEWFSFGTSTKTAVGFEATSAEGKKESEWCDRQGEDLAAV